MVEIRAESIHDADAVAAVNEAAFGRPDEALMVAELTPGAIGDRRGVVRYDDFG